MSVSLPIINGSGFFLPIVNPPRTTLKSTAPLCWRPVGRCYAGTAFCRHPALGDQRSTGNILAVHKFIPNTKVNWAVVPRAEVNLVRCYGKGFGE